MARTKASKTLSPPIRLADQVTADRGPALETILARVRMGLEPLKQEYLGEARDELAALDGHIAEAKAAAGSARRQAIDKIYLISHDVRGMAGSYDYPLLTRIGSSLCRLIEGASDLDPLELEVIELHIGAMRVVLAKRMTGDGGTAGRVLAEGIEAAAQKCRGAAVTR